MSHTHTHIKVRRTHTCDRRYSGVLLLLCACFVNMLHNVTSQHYLLYLNNP